MAETQDVCFEDGFPWLPPHVLDEQPCFHCKDHELKYPRYLQHRHNFRPSPPPPPAAAADIDPIFQQLKLIKSTTPRLQRGTSRRYQVPQPPPAAAPSNNMGFGGPGNGMQAVFLDSPQKSCGTGVFLPRSAGTTYSHTSIKPACPPVLLPSRVVQALNLNVHEIGFQIKHRTDKHEQLNEPRKQYKNVDCSLQRNKKKRDASSAQYSSPEIFLPKEWTY